ncbi:MAG TPA: hypothetical protein VNU19_14820, partial [Candidatus Acidoferrum sp.]|nr:hypothetical protein [Candidatus Acidoferrum sp.]
GPHREPSGRAPVACEAHWLDAGTPLPFWSVAPGVTGCVYEGSKDVEGVDGFTRKHFKTATGCGRTVSPCGRPMLSAGRVG